MSRRLLNFNAATTLTGSVDSEVTELPVASAAAFVTLVGGGDSCIVRVGDELMLVTGATTDPDVLTVLRGEEGFTPTAHASGAVVRPVLSAGHLNELTADSVQVEDVADVFVAANLEDVLSEVAALLTVGIVADPGDGQTVDLSAVALAGKRAVLELAGADAGDETRVLPDATADMMLLQVLRATHSIFKITLTVGQYLDGIETGAAGVEMPQGSSMLLLISERRHSATGWRWRVLAKNSITYPEAP